MEPDDRAEEAGEAPAVERELPSRMERLLRRSPLLPAALAAMLGIALIDRGAWTLLAAAAAMLAIAVCEAMRRQRPALAGLALAALLALAAGAMGHHRQLSKIHAFPLADTLAQGRSVDLSGRGWFASRPGETQRSSYGTLHLVSIVIGGHEIACDHRVPVWIQQREASPAYGEVYDFSGSLMPLDSPSAPGGFDPVAYHFRNSGSLGRLEVRPGDVWEQVEGERGGSRLVAFAQGCRDRMEARLLEGLSPAQEPYARLVAAMALGARESSPEELEDHFRLSGTMHLFAVSGLHVGVVAGLVVGVFALARLPLRAASALAIPLVLFYALLTGLRPSAVRAGVMLAVVLAGFALRERPRLLNSLALAALILLAADTQQLFLPGFQLSFAVVLFLILFAGPMQRLIAVPWLSDPFLPMRLRSTLRRGKDRAVRASAAALAVSAVSWLGSLGLLAWHFQSVAPVGILSNVAMVPLASFLVAVAMGALLCFGLSLGMLGSALNQVCVFLAAALTWMAHGFGSLPGAHLHTGGTSLPRPPPAAVTLDLFGDGGEGGALLSYPGRARGQRSYWMIDTGSDRSYERQALPLLRNRGVNRLDALVLTHGDVGHIGAAPRVLAQLRPALVFESSAPNRSPAGREIEALLEARGTPPRIALSAGRRLLIGGRGGDALLVETLWPPGDRPGRIADDGCLVLRLHYAGWRVLLSSDVGLAAETELLASGGDLSADLWVRGQHLEAPGGAAEFVAAVDPRAVVSSSADFPVHERIPDSLRRLLDERGTVLYALGESGVVTVELSEGVATVVNHGEPPRPLRLRMAPGPGRKVEVEED